LDVPLLKVGIDKQPQWISGKIEQLFARLDNLNKTCNFMNIYTLWRKFMHIEKRKKKENTLEHIATARTLHTHSKLHFFPAAALQCC